MRSAIATRWCGSTLAASDASAPFGMRIATGGMCSNESGIEKRRTFMTPPDVGEENTTSSRQPVTRQAASRVRNGTAGFSLAPLELTWVTSADRDRDDHGDEPRLT